MSALLQSFRFSSIAREREREREREGKSTCARDSKFDKADIYISNAAIAARLAMFVSRGESVPQTQNRRDAHIREGARDRDTSSYSCSISSPRRERERERERD